MYRALLPTGTAVAAVLLVAGPAHAACDSSSGACTEPPAVLSESSTRETAPAPAPTTARRQSVSPSTLPLTGGELVTSRRLRSPHSGSALP